MTLSINRIFKRPLLLLLPALFIYAPAYATITIPEKGHGEISIQKDILILEDREGKLTLEDITSPASIEKFRANDRGIANYGYTSSVFWVKMVLRRDRPDNRKWYLKLKYPPLDHVTFYYPGEKGALLEIKTGDALPFHERPVMNREFLFPLDFVKGEMTCFLRLATTGVINFPLYLVEDSYLHQLNYGTNFLSGLFYGGLLILTLYNILFFLFVRERSYLYYAIHVLFITIYLSTSPGIAFEFLWPDHPFLNTVMDIFTSNMLFFFLGLFTMEFLQTRNNLPRLHPLLLIATAIVGTAGFLVFALERKYILQPANYSILGLIIILFVIAIVSAIKKVRQAYIFLLAWTVGLGASLLMGLFKTLLIHDIGIGQFATQAGALLNVVLVSLGMADHLNYMKNSLNRSKMQIQRQNEELQATNEELLATNEEFEAQNDELIEAFRKIENSEQRFRQLADLLPQAIYELDREGRLDYTNRHGFILSGYSPEEMKLKINIYALFDARDHERMRRDLEEIAASGSMKNAEYTLRKKDGSDIPVLAYTAPILSNGRLTGFRGLAIDISERKKTEVMMIQSEKMMTVASLSAGMAHEINNPLSIIRQAAQNMKRRLSPGISKNSETAEAIGLDMGKVEVYMQERGITGYITAIEESSIRAGNIVSNMLNFSRKTDVEMSLWDINEIMDMAIQLAQKDYDLKKQYDFRHVEIIRDYGSVPAVPMIHTEIEQVIFNLLRNAAQAMFDIAQEGYSPRIVLSSRKAENCVRIDITDNGPGIKPENQKHIFEPFFTTKPAGVGTGLGLSVTYFIITRNHGGSIYFESAPGKGTTFTIELPLVQSGMTA